MSLLLKFAGLSPQTFIDPDVVVPQSYLEWIQATVTERLVLCELQPAEVLTVWTPSLGLAAVHEAPWSSFVTGRLREMTARSFTKNTANRLELPAGTFGALLNGAGAVSVAARVLPRSFSPAESLDDVVVASTVASTASAMWLSVGNGFVSLRGRSQTSDAVQAVTDALPLDAGIWHDIGGTLDFAADTIRTYRNGEGGTFNTFMNFGSATYVHGSATLPDRIGGPIATVLATRQMDGLIDYVAIWRGDIGEGAFAALHAGVHPMSIRPDVLAFYMTLGESGPTASDLDLVSKRRSIVVGSVPVEPAPSRLEAAETYRRLDYVRQNDVVLTQVGSAAATAATPGSFYLDRTSARLYVRTTSGLPPTSYETVAAYFTLFLATTEKDFPDGELYEPKLTGTLPTVDSAAEQWYDTVKQTASGSVEIVNASGFFDGIARPPYIWKNKRARLIIGGGTMPQTEYQAMATLLIDYLAVKDQVVTLGVRAHTSALQRGLPLRTIGKTQYPYLSDGAEGTYKPLLYGRKSGIDPPLVDQTAKRTPDGDPAQARDVYLLADPEAQTIHNVQAVRVTRTGGGVGGTIGETRQLEAGVEFIMNNSACELTVLGYPSDNWSVRVDATGKPGGVLGYLSRFGEIATDLLLTVGEGPGNLDMSSFAAVDAAAPFELSCYIRDYAEASAAITLLQQSVLGSLYAARDGRWSAAVIDPRNLTVVGELDDAAFSSWAQTERIDTVHPTTRVYFDQRPATREWAVVTATDSAAEYAYDTTDGLNVYTALVEPSHARLMAQRYRVLATHPEVVVSADMRGMELMIAELSEHVLVSRRRAPTPGGRYDGQRMRVLGLEKTLNPTAVRVTLGDLAGVNRIYGRIRKIGPSPPATWATATAHERATYVFIADSEGKVGGSRENAHIIW